LKKAFRQPEPSKTAVFLEVDSSENGLFNRLLTKLGALSDHQRLIRRRGVAPLIYQYGEKVIDTAREAGL
jgi:hypothetical protein